MSCVELDTLRLINIITLLINIYARHGDARLDAQVLFTRFLSVSFRVSCNIPQLRLSHLRAQRLERYRDREMRAVRIPFSFSFFFAPVEKYCAFVP